MKTWGTPHSKEDKPHNHVDLVQLLDIVNLEQGTEVAGGRGYYLMGAGALLNQVLTRPAALQSPPSISAPPSFPRCFPSPSISSPPPP